MQTTIMVSLRSERIGNYPGSHGFRSDYRTNDQTHHELVSVISDLNDDEQADLIALIWLGHGDVTLAEWQAARDAEQDIGRQRTPRYVIGLPSVSGYLEEGLALFSETIGG